METVLFRDKIPLTKARCWAKSEKWKQRIIFCMEKRSLLFQKRNKNYSVRVEALPKHVACKIDKAANTTYLSLYSSDCRSAKNSLEICWIKLHFLGIQGFDIKIPLYNNLYNNITLVSFNSKNTLLQTTLHVNVLTALIKSI